jgi:hypothetical protein
VTGSTWATAAARRQWRRAATVFPAASHRFFHKWNRSATWIACGAPVLTPSNGTVGYWNCLNACADQVSSAAGGGRYGRKWSATMPAMALAS